MKPSYYAIIWLLPCIVFVGCNIQDPVEKAAQKALSDCVYTAVDAAKTESDRIAATHPESSAATSDFQAVVEKIEKTDGIYRITYRSLEDGSIEQIERQAICGNPLPGSRIGVRRVGSKRFIISIK